MREKTGLQKMLLGAALGLALLAPAQSSCSPASQSAPQPEDKFAVMDVNRDGKVVLEEFQAASPNMNEQAFVVIDRNKDNAIDRVEWAQFIENHGSQMQPPREGAPMNNIPGDPLIPPPDSNDLPLVRPPMN